MKRNSVSRTIHDVDFPSKKRQTQHCLFDSLSLLICLFLYKYLKQNNISPKISKNICKVMLINCKFSTLISLLLSLSVNSQNAPGCDEVLLTKCDRNYCENQIIDGLPTKEICQLSCKLAPDFCQSWAFSRTYKVNQIPKTQTNLFP